MNRCRCRKLSITLLTRVDTKEPVGVCATQVVRADVYVAERYGGWQEVVLNSLAAQFDACSKDFRGELREVQNAVVEAVKASGTAGALADRALKGLVIPFAKLKVDEAKKGGLQVSCRTH